LSAPSASEEEAPRTAQPTQGAGRGWFVACVATLVMTVSYIDRQTLSAIAVPVRAALNISHSQYGSLTAAFAMAYLVGAPLAGALLDRVGARRGLVYAVFVWSGIAALHAAARSIVSLFLLRILLGLAEAPSFPGAAQAVRRALPPEHRSAGFGLLFTGSSIGAMIAAPLALLLSAKYNWRLAFVLTAIVGLAWIPLWLAVTDPARANANANANARADADADADAEEDAPPSGGFLLARGAMWRAIIAVIASAPAIMIVLYWFPQYLSESRHATQKEMAALLWIPPLAFDGGALSFGALASALRSKDGGPPRWLLPAAAALAASLALVPYAGTSGEAVFFGSISMAGGAGVYVLATSEVMTRIHPTEASRAAGLSAAAQSLSHIVASPLVGVAVDRTHSYAGSMTVLGLLLVPGALAWALWPRSPMSRPMMSR
jgi:ACS family hexuronate transporter-like MFS transporter